MTSTFSPSFNNPESVIKKVCHFQKLNYFPGDLLTFTEKAILFIYLFCIIRDCHKFLHHSCVS